MLHQQQLQQHQQHQHQQQQQGPAPVESRRSTRRLIKNILAGAPNLNKADQARPEYTPHHHPSHSQHAYDNTAGLARRPSKRISNPPALRTGPSQVSLDQQPAEWQSQGPQTQPSPLQNNPHEFQPTLRRVPTNQDTSPYSDEGGFIHQHGQIHIQTKLTPDHHQQLGQVAFDPTTRQYQFIPHSPQRQSTIQDRQQQQQQFDGAAEQGRNSPQPSEDPEKAFKDLLTKYKNVKRLYFDGKTQIEQLNGQVEQLQNAVANQRITQSRTALDDNEYMTRFNRLNGAINNLSFNIRKDWVSVPSWLESYVSTDALKTGKQEMTAVGRAVITRWIVEEVFHGCFHPGLDPELSRQLKEVEKNIRRGNYTMTSQEEHDALTSKVVSWRMTTLDGLHYILQSAESSEHRQDFIRKATSNLTAYLFQHLTEPPPAGVDGSASMIVELAVGIAANLPMESRDVAIIYPLPQDNLQPNIMEVEKAPLPPIETRPPDSDGDADSRGEENGKDSGGEKSSSKERSKSRAALPPKDANKLRFAGFLAVEVRGRQVLVKAPVWTLG
ncbi:hypothetical protein UCDDA912_g00571 [Diaporthe ampelina]|uniref:S-adenosylmethionine-dependent methyltransferase-like protein n=1 Tax=Diaporthe ampelina TaxID=1214573 RepID=A0A0G2IG42_9PEZI|nr:hypothetical protein UCDDA912_g00571 [Diaporthe ampelina]